MTADSQPHIELIYIESWRAEAWDEDVLSRPGWQVRCSVHGLIGNPIGFAYAQQRYAQAEATKHQRRHHQQAPA
jgi:hypothetical protein